MLVPGVPVGEGLTAGELAGGALAVGGLAAGIPAKYEHVYAQFSSGNWYGHVIALVYVNGVWYKADGTSSRNYFGVVNNWNTKTATLKGIYRSLPF